MAFTQIKTNLIANSAITQEKIDPLVELGGGSSVTTSNTAPVSPSSGDMWYNTTNGKLFVYYNSNWVEGQSTNQGIGSRVVDVYTASANQVTFTTSSGYTVGYVDVYINGIKILPADFTATNATTVILGEVSDANDEVVIISWTLQPGVASFTSDIFTANGAQTAFTLSTTPSSKNQTSVVIDGVTQVRDTYSVNGSLLTFSETPLSNSVIEVTTAKGSAFLTTSYNDLTDKPDLTGLGIKISNIQVTNSGGTVLDDTAVDTAGGYIVLTGSGFASGCQVIINNVPATSTTFVNSTTVRAQLPATAAGTYIVYLANTDGSVGIRVNGVTFSASPSWITGSSLEGLIDTAISLQLSATGASTFTLQAGSTLPTGLTLTSDGLLSGTVTGITQETVYSFTVIASDAENQDSPRTFSITITVSELYFNRTVLAINGDVNTFITDASSNNFPITVTGDTKPSAFSPYNTNWSNFFDGTGDYLTWTGTTLSGDFTAECWIFKTAVDASGYTNVFSGTIGNSQFTIDSGTASSIGLVLNASIVIANSGTSVTPNRWHHLAWVREGSTCRAYVNGVQLGTGTSSASFQLRVIGSYNPSDSGGYEMNGYISNVRITNSCLYPGGTTFTPSTTPLTTTVSSGTVQLLTCQSNTFKDNSTNNFAITKNGDTKVSAFGPFTETDTTTGSTYFDGTGDYLTVPDSESFDLPGDFTVEFFAYATGGSARRFFQLGNQNSGQNGLLIYSSLANLIIVYVNGAASITGPTLVPYQWVHIACVRQGAGANNLKLYVNGSLAAQATNTTSFTGVAGNGISLGAEYSPFAATSETYMSDFRLVKGTAVYTAAFTPPIAPLTAVSGTQLLTLQNRQPVNNHTFIDVSGNSNLITRTGNVTQGSFSPFSPAGWSNYFDTSIGGLTVTSNTALDMSTGDFTIEGWYYPNAADSDFNSTFYLGTINGASALGLAVSNVSIRYRSAGSGDRIVVGSLNLTNSWNHIALVRASGTTKIYLNGTAVGSPLSDSTSYSSSGNLSFSRPDSASFRYVGYISNFRIVKGTAVYTSNFTPSTSTLTAIANTSLLTCQSNRFIDNSANNFAITQVGNTKVVNFSPFTSTTTYSPITHGGSAYFDGSDYVVVGQGFNTSLGTNNWTVEGWFYPTGTSTSQRLFWHYGNTIDIISIYFNASTGVITGQCRATNLADTTLTGTATRAKPGQWTHVALVRESTTSVKLYVNGVLDATATIGATASFNETTVATVRYGASSNPDANYFTGYLSDWRFVKGRAVYTGAFTPPASSLPLTADSAHQLEFNNAAIIDASTRNVMETGGDAKIVTNLKKFGTGSMSFDGTGDHVSILGGVDTQNFYLGGSGENFTIEMWLYTTSMSSQTLIVGNYNSWASGYAGQWAIVGSAAGYLGWMSDAGNLAITDTVARLNQWVHLAVCRNGSTITMYVNGTSIGTQTSAQGYTSTTSTGLKIGGNIASISNYIGYIDDLRITKGVARYTANFTPPTTTFLTR